GGIQGKGTERGRAARSKGSGAAAFLAGRVSSGRRKGGRDGRTHFCRHGRDGPVRRLDGRRRGVPDHSPLTSHPLRYRRRTRSLASLLFVICSFGASHSSVVFTNRVARQPRSTASVRLPE